MASYRSLATRVACYLRAPTVTPEQIKQLRSELRCTARELATTLGVPSAEIQSWEAGDRFPTKRWIARLESLRAQGPDCVVRSSRKASPSTPSPIEQLNNPEIWRLLRKLLAHRQLFSEVARLADAYADPATPAERE
jgi:DNA-binding transcriptional regulator YiaG